MLMGAVGMLVLGGILAVLSAVAVRRQAPWLVQRGLQGAWVMWLLELALRVAGVQAPWMPPQWVTLDIDDSRPVVEVAGIGRSASLFSGYAGTKGPRVVLVGDSFTEGQGVHIDDALPRQLQRSLDARGQPVRLASLGLSGENVDGEAVVFETLGQPLTPDVVVVVFVLNDFYLPMSGDLVDFITDHRSEEGPAATGWQTWDALSALVTLRRLTADMTRAYQEAYRPGTPASDEGAVYLDFFGQRGAAAGARMVLAIYPLMTRLDDYPFADAHAHIAALGQAAGFEVVDLLPAFVGQDASALWVQPADQHPNATGHRLAAEHLADALVAGPWPTVDAWGCVPALAGPLVPEAFHVGLAAHCAAPARPESLIQLTQAALDRFRTQGDGQWLKHAGIFFIAAWSRAESAGDGAALDRLRAIQAAATEDGIGW